MDTMDHTTPLTYGSLFTGVGGFDLGFDQAGYTCKWQVEWDKHCQQTLAYHWPDVPRWSDVCDVDGTQLPPVDIITFGSPCQDLSVAGKRAGIDGNRSSMFFQAARIIKEMRDATNGIFPRITIWENVPGALSSNGGKDFETVLATLDDCGALAQWWYVLDAQFFGVPQRRRRVFVISVFDPAIADRAGDGEILSVGTGRRRNTSTRRTEGKEVAGTLGGGSGNRGWSPDTDRMTFIPTETFQRQRSDQYEQTDLASTVAARDYKSATDLIVEQTNDPSCGS